MIYVLVVIVYVLVLLGISAYKSRVVKTDEDFMVAGRGVPVYMLVPNRLPDPSWRFISSK